MPSFFHLASALLATLLVRQSAAHFVLNYPETIGFNEDVEATAPCGGFTVDFSTDKVTQFHVSGDSIAPRSTHPTTTWLFRATIGVPSSSTEWTALTPSIEQKHLGDFCRSDISVPADFVGKNGTIGVVASSPDGVLYQCAAVTFVAGAAPSIPSSCSNSTGVTASYVSESVFSSLSASGTATHDSGADDKSDHVDDAKSSSAASPGAMVGYSHAGAASIAWLGMVGSVTVLACLL